MDKQQFESWLSSTFSTSEGKKALAYMLRQYNYSDANVLPMEKMYFMAGIRSVMNDIIRCIQRARNNEKSVEEVIIDVAQRKENN